MKKIMDSLSRALTAIIAVLLAAVILLALFQVFARNVLEMSTPWTEEVAKYLLIWLTFLGAPVVYYKNEHLMVDLFYAKYPPKLRQGMRIFFAVFALIFAAYLTIHGVELCMHRSTLSFVSPASGIPRVYVYSALPIGSALLCLYTLYDIGHLIMMFLGKAEDTTGSHIVDESKTLAEIDAELREKGEGK